MPEILFYSLERKSLEDVLPDLLERTAGRGWRAVVRVDSDERMRALDVHLWTYSEQSFLAHGTPDLGHSARQPVYLTTGKENPNNAAVLFLAGSEVPSEWTREFADFTRIVVIFDGQNPEISNAAEASFRSAQQSGHQTAFWRQSQSGKWQQQIPQTPPRH